MMRYTSFLIAHTDNRKNREEYFQKLGIERNTYQTTTISEKIQIINDLLSISDEEKTVQINSCKICLSVLSESNSKMVLEKLNS